MKNVSIGVGQSSKFALEASAGTGYAWMLASLPTGAFLDGMETTHASLPGGMVTTTFTIFGGFQGSGTLRFVLARPWAPVSIVEERSFQVNVVTGPHIQPLYAAALQEAKQSGDREKMRELAAIAEQQLNSSNEIQAALSSLRAELAVGAGPIRTLYGPAIQAAVHSGDLAQMMSVAAQAESQKGNPEVNAALPSLHAAIASHEQRQGAVVPPYGVAIQQAIASGNTAAMKQIESNAAQHIKNLEESLSSLRSELDRNGGSAVPLYGVSLQQALASGDVVRMRSMVNQAESAGSLSSDAQSVLAQVKEYLTQTEA